MGKKILKFSLDIIIIACLVAAGYFGLKIFERFQEDQQLNSSYESIRKDTKTGKHINWNKLKKINSDIVAWIYVKGTNIDYPVVQGKTNQSYLHTNFKKQYTKSVPAARTKFHTTTYMEICPLRLPVEEAARTTERVRISPM